MGWNPFKSVKNAVKNVTETMGDFSPFTNRGIDKQIGAIKDYGGTAISLFGAATGQPWISTIGSSMNAYQGANQAQNDARAANAWERQQFNDNVKLQREFAQQGIRWRVADARAAGIHPLAALGAQTQSFSPISVGGKSFSSDQPLNAAMSELGQNIDRARLAKATAIERRNLEADRALNQEYMRAQIYGQQLDNEGQLIANQKALSDMQARSGPSMPPPIPLGASEATPARYTVSAKGNPGIAAGMPTTAQFFIDERGVARRYPAPEIKQAMEDNFMLELPWYIQNRVVPFLQGSGYGPDAPSGYKWVYSRSKQGWVMVKK